MYSTPLSIDLHSALGHVWFESYDRDTVTTEREVSPMDVLATVPRAPFVLPADPLTRTAYLRSRVGTRIMLSSGDFSIDGMLVTVIAPAANSDHPTPVVIIDTGLERIAGPVLEGDMLV